MTEQQMFNPRMAAIAERIRNDAAPLVIREDSIHRATGIQPTAWVLPLSWDPGPGVFTTEFAEPPIGMPCVVFGKPVMWDPEERMGLFYEVAQ